MMNPMTGHKSSARTTHANPKTTVVTPTCRTGGQGYRPASGINAPAQAQSAAIMLCLILVLLLAPLAAAKPGEPIQDIEPLVGPVGTAITISTDEWDDSLELRFGAYEVEYEREMDEITFTIPEVSPGEYYFVVSEDGETIQRFCCFEITEASSTQDVGSDTTSSGATTSITSCQEDGYNIQCNTFGKIRMPSQEDIRGETVRMETQIELTTNLVDRDARWIMFSVRNVTGLDDEPVSVGLQSFRTPAGEIYVSETEQTEPNQVNLWVHVVDVPVNQPIVIEYDIGVSERGAYRLETLVLGFDRGYEPIQGPDGKDMSLFSFTLLGVNGATSPASVGGSSGGVSLLSPGIGLAPVIGLLVLAIAYRRWKA